MNLPEKIVAIHRALDDADIPHAFGGALALAWCTQQARGTADIDLNLFLEADEIQRVADALPDGVIVTPSDVTLIQRDGQARLWWGETPVDVFFNTTPFHEAASARVRREPFLGDELPFLACHDLAVFKAFFNRSQDWVDLEKMADAGTLDVEAVLGVLVRYLGAPDERIDRLRALG